MDTTIFHRVANAAPDVCRAQETEVDRGPWARSGLVMFTHTQASWPRAPGPLISRNGSHVGQVGAVGQAGMFIAPLSAESWCQAHRSSPDTHPTSPDHEPTMCQAWGGEQPSGAD